MLQQREQVLQGLHANAITMPTSRMVLPLLVLMNLTLFSGISDLTPFSGYFSSVLQTICTFSSFCEELSP